jgi:hypothetical protein
VNSEKKNSPAKTSRTNYHKVESESASTKKSTKNTVGKKAVEERFDRDNYMKSGTAFNLSCSFSQNLTNKGSVALGVSTFTNSLEGNSFTERILEENNIHNLVKRKGIPTPIRAMSTDERKVLECTFSPKFFKNASKYSNVKPRISNHLDEPQVVRSDLAAIVQNRSFQRGTITERLHGVPSIHSPIVSNKGMLILTNCFWYR